MNRKLQDFVSEVSGIVKADQDALNETDIIAAVNKSVRALTRKGASEAIYSADADGTVVAWEAPSDYDLQYSAILKVCYPCIEDGATSDTELEPANYSLRYNSTDEKWEFRLYNIIPAAGKHVLWTYTKPHLVGDTTSTILSAFDEDSVIHCAASLCFRILAAVAARNSAQTFEENTSDYSGRVGKYLELAKFYLESSGLKGYLSDSSIKGATGQIEWASTNDDDQEFLTHGRN